MSVERALAALGRVRTRSVYAYASTSPLEEVELVDKNGARLAVLVKRLGQAAASESAEPRDPRREIAAYRLLGAQLLGAPRCYGTGPDWLMLEKVAGTELWQYDQLDAWAATARWAATLHRRFRAEPPAASWLARHDASLHRRLLDRALLRLGAGHDWLEPAGELALARLARLAPTLIHGELYPSNVLVGENRRVSVVDWETASIGPGAIDLAALLTGWRGEQREAIRAAYGPIERLDLAAAELVLATQWLGRGRGWQPPAEHQRDWLAEASVAAEQLLSSGPEQ